LARNQTEETTTETRQETTPEAKRETTRADSSVNKKATTLRPEDHKLTTEEIINNPQLN
jgi:hypothetical protein